LALCSSNKVHFEALQRLRCAATENQIPKNITHVDRMLGIINKKIILE